MPKPCSFKELQEFYASEYCPLYDRFNVQLKKVPQELHFEVAAAFDHLMRAGDLAPGDLERVAGHLKRATFDAFKLLFERVRSLYTTLMEPCYADVEDGKFQPRITRLWNEAQRISMDARSHERLAKKVDMVEWNTAFDIWKTLIPILDTFEAESGTEKLIRVKRASRHARIRKYLYDGFLLLAGALLGWLVSHWLS